MSTKSKSDDPQAGSSMPQDSGNASAAAPGKKQGGGQKVSQERGTATNHKKNPGKRPHKGGH